MATDTENGIHSERHKTIFPCTLVPSDILIKNNTEKSAGKMAIGTENGTRLERHKTIFVILRSGAVVNQ